jgi:hypothetical protein
VHIIALGGSFYAYPSLEVSAQVAGKPLGAFRPLAEYYPPAMQPRLPLPSPPRTLTNGYVDETAVGLLSRYESAAAYFGDALVLPEEPGLYLGGDPFGAATTYYETRLTTAGLDLFGPNSLEVTRTVDGGGNLYLTVQFFSRNSVTDRRARMTWGPAVGQDVMVNDFPCAWEGFSLGGTEAYAFDLSPSATPLFYQDAYA